MPVFEYAGIDSKGKRVTGQIDAENERAARVKIRRLGVFPTTMNLEGEAKGGGGLGRDFDLSKYFQRVKTQDVAVMTRQLATLVGAHIPLVDSLSALADQLENPKLKSIIARAREKVTEGTKLSDAIRGHPKVFSDVFINMVNAGEQSGTLDTVLSRLADFTEGQARLRSKVAGAMVYPIIMAVVGISLVVFLLTQVVPEVAGMIKEMGKELPLPTTILMNVGNALINYWYLFLICLPLSFYGVKKILKTPNGKKWWDEKALKLPLFGRLTRMVIIARFARTLATLISSGVPLLTAIDIVKNIITNSKIKAVIEQTRDNVREGQSVAETLKRSGEFPPLVTHMIAVGEKTGELETMLERVADAYDTEVTNAVTTMTTILEPMMILVMAGVVGFIVVSIMLPMLELSNI